MADVSYGGRERHAAFAVDADPFKVEDCIEDPADVLQAHSHHHLLVDSRGLTQSRKEEEEREEEEGRDKMGWR